MPELLFIVFIDSCSLNPCQNGGNCSSDASGSYTCACPHGIGGQNCTEGKSRETITKNFSRM